MKNNMTELVFILDKSGSMAGLESDTVGGFNAMIEKQKKMEGTVCVSTLLFSNDSEVIHDRVDISKIEPMTEEQYFVGGRTALMDALGDAIRHIGLIHRYAREEDVPEHTIFVITTDGMENASCRYSAAEIRRMIRKQEEKCGWEFLFLGANIDAVETARSFGIPQKRAANYRASTGGTRKLYECVEKAVASIRVGEEPGEAWCKDLDTED